MDETITIDSTVFERHPTSLAAYRGTLFLNHEERRCVRSSVVSNASFLSSGIYKNKEGIFWPQVKQIDHTTPITSDSVNMQHATLHEIEYLDHIVYWTEMTNKQIKDCMVFLCDVLHYLNSNGWTTQTHLWNINLKNGKPILLDVGDFTPVSVKNWQEVQKATLISMLRHGVSDHTPKTMNSWLKDGDKVLSDILNFNFHHSYVSYLPKVREVLSSAETVNQTNYWDSYNKTQYLSEDQILTSVENKKDKPVCDYIKQNKPRTMVDLGCNSGRHSLYAALQGVRCIGLDNAAKTVDEANKAAAALDLTCSFAYLDLFKSDVKLGLRETPHKRFKSDMAIAPALIHHMFMSSGNIEKCIRIICEYAHKNIAIEFVPHTDPAISRSIDNWFGIEDAIRVIDNNGFKTENIVDSNTSGRKWIFAQKYE